MKYIDIENIKKHLNELKIEYITTGENPVFFQIKMGNKNKNNVLITNTAGITASFVITNNTLLFSVSGIFDTKNENRLKILEQINQLNRDKTLKEKFYIDKSGYICMKFFQNIHDENSVIQTLLDYRSIFLESSFIEDNF